MKLANLFFGIFIILTATVAVPAQQASPTAVLKGPVEAMIGILTDPQYQTPAQKKVQQEKMWDLVRGLFDFEEISKRALAANWKTFSASEQKEFVDVFGRRLGDTYIEKIQGEFHNQTVTFLGEDPLSDARVMVKTKIVETGKEIPVHYAMMQRGGSWRVYDVKVEGVSLVQNYRNQFQKILMKKTPLQLIEQVRQKIAR